MILSVLHMVSGSSYSGSLAVSWLQEAKIHSERDAGEMSAVCPLSFYSEPEAGGGGVDGRVRRVRLSAPA